MSTAGAASSISDITGCPIFAAAFDLSDVGFFHLANFSTTPLPRVALVTPDGPPGLPPLRSG